MATSNSTIRDKSTLFTVPTRRVFATLVRLLGDFDLAEALHDALSRR
jgi:predicted RNA polymerase sigma factor